MAEHHLATPRGERESAPATTIDLFVIGTGQVDNIGDVLLRREYFDRLRRLGRLHLFMGSMDVDFLDALRLKSSDVVYPDIRTWHAAAWRSLAQGPTWFIDKPGELALDRSTLDRQVKLAPLAAAVRVRGGQVLRTGMAVRTLDRRRLSLMRLLFRSSTVVRWRDTTTGPAFGFGQTAPDWAFGWRGPQLAASAAQGRSITVSYRGDRDAPSNGIVEALRQVARDQDRELVVVTQVRRDASRSAQLAERLGAELVPWPEDRGLADHEEVLRNVYRQSALVVSDRLHVLVMGMTEGAVPLCLTAQGEAKVGRHLDAIGYPDSSLASATLGVTLTGVIEQQLSRGDEARRAVEDARSVLQALTDHLGVLASRVHRGARSA